MNRNLWLLALCQGLFLTNNVTFIAINGLVGLQLAPHAWMATLPVMGYVVGGALAAPLVARTQTRFGRRGSFQIGLIVALGSALLAAYAAAGRHFWLLMAATVIAGYYNANGQLYRFAAAELVAPGWRMITPSGRPWSSLPSAPLALGGMGGKVTIAMTAMANTATTARAR